MSRTSRGAIFLLLALLVGGVCGYVVRHAANPPGALPPPFLPESPEPRLDQPFPESDPAPEYPPVPRGAAPPADAVSGRGMITGRVHTADGDPLAGVVVRADLSLTRRANQRITTGVPPEPDVGEMIQRMADRERFSREVRREAVTGADGSYVLSGLAEQRYLIRAYLRGFTIAPEEGGSRAAGPGETCNFRAKRVASLQARVLLPDGTVPEVAWFHFESGGRRESRSWRPGDPVILLGPGAWRATVSAGSMREYELTVDALTIAEDEDGLLETFRLRMRPGITGRVFGVGHPPKRRYEVRYLPVSPNEEPDLREFRSRGKRPLEQTDPERRFGVFGIPDGRYAVGLVGDGQVLDLQMVELAGEPLQVDLTAPPFDPTEYLTVRLLDPEGKLLSLGHVDSLFLPDDLSGGGVAVGSGYVNPDGTFRVLHPPRLPEHAKKPGRYFLEVDSQSCGRRRVAYPGPPASTATVSFEAPARLTIVLEGHDRQEYLEHTEIYMMREEHGQLVHQPCPGFRKLGLDGRKLYAPLAPGRYEIEVRSKLGTGFGFTVLKVPVDLASGERTLTIPLPDLHTLTLLVPGADPGTEFQVRDAVSEMYRFASERKRPRDGRVTFGPMPTGDYVITENRRDGPRRTMRLTITHSTEIPFRPE